jgi:hypothetical protein
MREMKKYAWLLIIVLTVAVAASAAEVRWRYSNNTYNATTSFGGTYHPGTNFVPGSSDYPVRLKTAHFGFGGSGVTVMVKVWASTGTTPGSILASFPSVTTSTYPTWTDVDLTGTPIIIPSNNFFLSTNNPAMGPLGVGFRGAMPATYTTSHFWSSNDASWSSWTTSDWAIEATVDTNYGVGVAPSSLGRVKAIYN